MLNEHEYENAFLWSDDEFELCTAFDTINKEEDDDACFWSEDGLKYDTSIERLIEQEYAEAFL